MTNTHGLTMRGLRKVSSDSKSLQGYYSGHYLQLNYCITSGKVWTDYFFSIEHNNWASYGSEEIVNCGNLTEPMTMQQIADTVYQAVSENKGDIYCGQTN